MSYLSFLTCKNFLSLWLPNICNFKTLYQQFANTPKVKTVFNKNYLSQTQPLRLYFVYYCPIQVQNDKICSMQFFFFLNLYFLRRKGPADPQTLANWIRDNEPTVDHTIGKDSCMIVSHLSHFIYLQSESGQNNQCGYA